MTRKEEINMASNELFNSFRCSKSYKMGFESGAMWADANPKSPWISVDDDLPCNHEELITLDEKRTKYVIAKIHCYTILSRMYKLDGKWHWEKDEPMYWFPIPESPKE